LFAFYKNTIIEKYIAKGYGISFRITSKETGVFPGSVGEEKDHVQYATPSWVRDAGAKGTVIVRSRISSWLPNWGDSILIQKLDHFHRAFASRYDGKSRLRYVDIGSIGDWGEGHSYFSSKVEASNAEIRAITDIHLKHYKNTQIVVSEDLIKYGKSRMKPKSYMNI